MKIYMLENVKNGKKYIGQTTKRIRDRLAHHYNRSDSPKIHNALRKYKKDGFKVVVLCECATKEELDKMEEHYINYYNTTDDKFGYNILPGGHGTYGGWKQTQEVKNKLSKRMSGKNNPFYGKSHTQETKDKISKNRKDKCLGKDNPMYGKTHSPEVKHKMKKCYLVLFPDGHEEIIHGMKEFCENHNLSRFHMCSVARGKRNHHKSFWCAYID